MIAFSNNGREDRVNQIYFMTPQGGSQTRISLDLNESAPVWSPDMKWLLYVISSNDYPFLYMRSSNQNYSTPEPYDRNKVTGRLGQVSEPAWSPDGQQVAFIRLDGGHKQLWSVIYATHGGSISRLTEDNDAEGPAWSPDSKWIVFSSVRDGKRDIYLMTVAGTLQTNLTNDDSVDLHPVWQPQPAVQN
jgi:TolB protein